LSNHLKALKLPTFASEAYIKSQAHEGWRLIRDRYDDGGFSGGSMDRPALQRLLDDVLAKRIDVIVVYKVDRLTRSLADFAKLVELFDANGVSFADAELHQLGVCQLRDFGLHLAGKGPLPGQRISGKHQGPRTLFSAQ
jgi:Resolvase, N terminal domain